MGTVTAYSTEFSTTVDNFKHGACEKLSTVISQPCGKYSL
ncbi:Hypothetical protein CpCap5W_2226 [Corynebacterium pseudotuberculosis]|nr:Hypothetical protein Cp3995_2178 [Corynebacterium pseudotuberculosis 3/99-5]AIG06353.1 hypothetical protein CPTA_00524 [Corynebacterium pseudotuberculosis]AIG09064.1 hypothetical protein CPTB_01008 [Corynebacterium pseudotuberculosis]AIG10962.1 hypothetical protein CPTC_00674 [Corynebacterium pseudotuberculosis]AKC74890.1 Hypothetical protein Cp226_2209 [Corynebacterium pseudotuberculosis]